MPSALDFIKDSLKILFGFLLLALVVLDFRDICQASRKILEMAGSIHGIEVAGVKVDFDENAVEQSLSMFGVPADKQKDVLDSIRALNSTDFIRLMAVGQLNNLCEYAHPTPRMREDVATDYRLQQKGLTEIEPNQKLTEEIARRDAPDGHESIGRPLECYEMTLTARGANVKTVIVQNLAPAFARSQTVLSASKVAALN